MVWYEVMFGGKHSFALVLRFRTKDEAQRYVDYVKANDPSVLPSELVTEVNTDDPTFFDDVDTLIASWQ